MKKTIKTLLTLGLLLLFTGNVWALPTTGDIVKMTTNPGENYGMEVIGGDFYNTFCLEEDEYFNPGHNYSVVSVTNYANEGGSGYSDIAGDDLVGISNSEQDFISQTSLWLYASYFDAVFGDRSDTLATRVQNAIWYAEDEIDDQKAFEDYTFLIALAKGDFTVTGWNIKVVNLVKSDEDHLDYLGSDTLRQSQLVGERAPVPEPATMVLFGIGLLGLAGIGRKKVLK